MGEVDEKIFDVICIGNITIDLYFKGDSLTFKDNRFQLAVGGKYVADTFYQGIGGGGANVAIGSQKNGLKAAVFGKIGNNPFKDLILSQLAERKIDYSSCEFEDNFYNISTILLSPSGERSIVTYETPHQTLFKIPTEYEKLNISKCVYLGNLPDISLREKTGILNHLKNKDILSIVNLGVHDCRKNLTELQPLLGLIDVLILNTHEWSELVKKRFENIDFTTHVISDIEVLKNATVIITNGERGSFGYQNGTVHYCQAEALPHVVDTTGAGDGYTAGFIGEYIKTVNLQSGMKKGAQYAKVILQKVGAN